MFHNIFFLKMDNLHFIPNNILTIFFFKELTKYKNDYKWYLNYIYNKFQLAQLVNSLMVG